MPVYRRLLSKMDRLLRAKKIANKRKSIEKKDWKKEDKIKTKKSKSREFSSDKEAKIGCRTFSFIKTAEEKSLIRDGKYSILKSNMISNSASDFFCRVYRIIF